MTSSIKADFNLRNNPIVASSQMMAQSIASNTTKPNRVIQFTDATWLVVCPADAERLHREGFAYAS